MFAGCSEISLNVIVKHVENNGIIRALCLFGGLVKFFQCLGGEKTLLDCNLLRGISTLADTMLLLENKILKKVY